MPKPSEQPTLEEHLINSLPKLQSSYYDEKAPYPPSRISMLTSEISGILTNNGNSENHDPAQIAETLLYIYSKDPENAHLISEFARATDKETILTTLNQYHENNKEPITTFDKGNEDFIALKKRFTDARQQAQVAAPKPSQSEPEQPH